MKVKLAPFQLVFGLILGIAILLGRPVSAADPPVIRWIAGLVPGAITETDGSMSGGFMYETSLWFVDRMNEYDHRFQIVPWKRTHALLAGADELYCSFALLKTADRAQLYYYSEPVQWALGFRAAFQTGNETVERALSKEDHLATDLFLAGKGLTGRVLGRTYNQVVDQFFTHMKDEDRLMEVSERAKLLEMLQKGRIDLMIDYPRVFLAGDGLRTVSITGVKRYNSVHFARVRTPEGKEVIRQVDALIAKQPVPPVYAGFRFRMLPDDHARELEQQFLNYSKRP
ncbi:hypothetical protein [Aestuariispira insulae]|nr:hypothetical protein [Aestuariispira insulae]